MGGIRVRGYLSRSFFLLDEDRYKKWDPWPSPMMDYIERRLFNEAKGVVQRDNCDNIDNYVDRIELLPAHGPPDFRPSTSGMTLFSLRCPSRLPVRIYLWKTKAGTLMVREASQSIALSDFLTNFRNGTSPSSVQTLSFWKAMRSDSCAAFPSHLQDDARQRWRETHVFRFMDLPAEIRQRVIEFYLGPSTILVSSLRFAFGETPRSPKRWRYGILSVNRECHEIASFLLLTKKRFYVNNNFTFEVFFDRLPDVARNTLRNLVLSLSASALLDVFGVAYEPGRGLNHSSARQGPYCFVLSSPSKISAFANLQALEIVFPPKAKNKSFGFRWGCQRVLRLWIWAAMRKHLRNIPHVKFSGNIKPDQRQMMGEIWAQERKDLEKGLVSGADELVAWQQGIWSTS